MQKWEIVHIFAIHASMGTALSRVLARAGRGYPPFYGEALSVLAFLTKNRNF